MHADDKRNDPFQRENPSCTIAGVSLSHSKESFSQTSTHPPQQIESWTITTKLRLWLRWILIILPDGYYGGLKMKTRIQKIKETPEEAMIL